MSDHVRQSDHLIVESPSETAPPAQPQATPRQPRLGELFSETRRAKGLELSDVAGVTNVRKEYLKALDEGRYDDLPEDVYTRNFIRLYAQAIGLDGAKALQLYRQERYGASASKAGAGVKAANSAQASARPQPVAAPKAPAKKAAKAKGGGFDLDFGTIIPTFLTVAVLIGLALWGFNSFFFQTSGPPTGGTTVEGPNGDDGGATAAPAEAVAPGSELDAPGGAVPGDGEATTAEDGSVPVAPGFGGGVLFSIVTDPPGAEVSIDNYDLGTAPIEDAPLTAGGSRMLTVQLDGYQTHEETLDLTSDQQLNISLSPQTGTEATTGSTPLGSSEGTIAINIEAESWLEVYQSGARGQGETLLYRTVQSGEQFEFDLPVYLHVGNGGGVRVSVDGEEQGLMGSSGQVIGRAFGN